RLRAAVGCHVNATIAPGCHARARVAHVTSGAGAGTRDERGAWTRRATLVQVIDTCSIRALKKLPGCAFALGGGRRSSANLFKLRSAGPFRLLYARAYQCFS